MRTFKAGTILTTLTGEPLKDGEHELTLGMVIAAVLCGKISNPHLGFKLAKQFSTEDEVSLKAEDVSFIKRELEANGKSSTTGFNALVIGQALDIIDGSGASATDDEE